MKRVSLSQAKRRKGPLYYRRNNGELVPVLCWRKWTARTVVVQVIGRQFVASDRVMLEAGKDKH